MSKDELGIRWTATVPTRVSRMIASRFSRRPDGHRELGRRRLLSARLSRPTWTGARTVAFRWRPGTDLSVRAAYEPPRTDRLTRCRPLVTSRSAPLAGLDALREHATPASSRRRSRRLHSLPTAGCGPSRRRHCSVCCRTFLRGSQCSSDVQELLSPASTLPTVLEMHRERRRRVICDGPRLEPDHHHATTTPRRYE